MIGSSGTVVARGADESQTGIATAGFWIIAAGAPAGAICGALVPA